MTIGNMCQAFVSELGAFQVGAGLSFLASPASVSVGDFNDRSDTTGVGLVVGFDGKAGR